MTRLELLRGTLDMLILQTLAREPQHGCGIARRLQQVTDDALQVDEGSLYPALYRMARRGWIEAHWGTSENNRRAKYYVLSSMGQKQLDRQASNWQQFTLAVSKVMRTAT